MRLSSRTTAKIKIFHGPVKPPNMTRHTSLVTSVLEYVLSSPGLSLLLFISLGHCARQKGADPLRDGVITIHHVMTDGQETY